MQTTNLSTFQNDLFLLDLLKCEYQNAFKVWCTLKQLGLHSEISFGGKSRLEVEKYNKVQKYF